MPKLVVQGTLIVLLAALTVIDWKILDLLTDSWKPGVIAVAAAFLYFPRLLVRE